MPGITIFETMTEAITKVYELHARLVEVYHMPSADNLLLSDFSSAFISLVKILNPKAPQNRSIYLFKPTYNFQNRAELDAHLLAASDYAQILMDRIATYVTLDLGNETAAVIFDYSQLLKETSKVYDLPADNFAGSRNKIITSYTAFGIASQFFWHPKEIRRSNTLNGFTIFALRQCLELGAKEILGIKNILKSDKTVDIYASQTPWQFIVDRRNASYWTLPFDAQELHAIYKWSNYFVHTGNDTMCYVTGLALLSIGKIFKLVKTKNWNHEDDFVYPLKISNYQKLKEDFESYLSGLKKPKLAEWALEPKLAHITGYN